MSPAAGCAAASSVGLVLVAVAAASVALAQQEACATCDRGQALEEFLLPEDAAIARAAHSTTHVLWPTYIENVSLTSDIGGWESPELHIRLAAEAERGFRSFLDSTLPGLSADHPARKAATSEWEEDSNKAFSAWQRALHHAGGDVAAAAAVSSDTKSAAGGGSSTWPDLEALAEYGRLRKVVEALSRRYLERTGIRPGVAEGLPLSLTSWAEVYSPGDRRPTASTSGHYHMAIFYARAGPSSGKLRFQDTRGHSSPYGREFVHTPRSGDLFLFPSWVGHELTIEEGRKTDAEGATVVFFFHINPQNGEMSGDAYHTDPTADLRFQKHTAMSSDLYSSIDTA